MLWAQVPLEQSQQFGEWLWWIGGRPQVVEGEAWQALLPAGREAPMRVQWLWERMRLGGQQVSLYANWGLPSEKFPFAPLPFPLFAPTGVFGTGHHPTTQMCLVALEHLSLDGKWVLDVGTGTGILAIAALHKGAKVIATEISWQVARWAQRNLQGWRQSRQWAVIVSDLAASLRGTFDVVVCNISAEALFRLLPDLPRLTFQGVLIASGWTGGEWRRVERSLRRHGWKVVAWQFFNGWMCLTAKAAILHSERNRHCAAVSRR